MKKQVDIVKVKLSDLKFHQLTKDRWNDFEILFGDRGACGGCWCMWWRLNRSQFNNQKGEGNKKAMKKLVSSGEMPGIIAYHDGIPIGWCALSQRDSYPVLEKSRVLKRVDDEKVWSIVCFFIHKKYRRQGITVELIKAALKYARTHGAKIVEAYPIDPKSGASPDVFVYTGLKSAFVKAGFAEIARRSATSPIMRYYLKKNKE